MCDIQTLIFQNSIYRQFCKEILKINLQKIGSKNRQNFYRNSNQMKILYSTNIINEHLLFSTIVGMALDKRMG